MGCLSLARVGFCKQQNSEYRDVAENSCVSFSLRHPAFDRTFDLQNEKLLGLGMFLTLTFFNNTTVKKRLRGRRAEFQNLKTFCSGMRAMPVRKEKQRMQVDRTNRT